MTLTMDEVGFTAALLPTLMGVAIAARSAFRLSPAEATRYADGRRNTKQPAV
ncbi:hypothetical protein ACFQ49_08185 [Kroppenstedtia eburnea]|uniref:hypothetical protein n=1 Tax=Kroppenstedtia eburnea TaxID=714067 RepID=UPI001562B733|nr:hypothetical protein [Kroppenstedtia eburnea]QKI81856.1 hypothetical protein GXN75_07520 [Kroppenstedtia eburnea]